MQKSLLAIHCDSTFSPRPLSAKIEERYDKMTRQIDARKDVVFMALILPSAVSKSKSGTT